MDKYDLVLDIIEHPEKYAPEQLAEIMSDPETGEIYNLLCKTESAIKAGNAPDVKAEWENFSDKQAVGSRRTLSWTGSRAASIAAIVGTSIAAVAAGIAVTVSVIGQREEPIAGEVTVAPSATTVATDASTARNDTVTVSQAPVMFENDTLEKIMSEIAETYGVEVKFNNGDAASLHLYYRLDPSLPLHEVVEQLNTFERINISQNGNILNID